VFVQEAVGHADALLTSARAHLFGVVGDMWETLVSTPERMCIGEPE